MTKIGFIGFGEVASHFSTALAEAGAEVIAYDVLMERAGGPELLEKRARHEGIRFVPLPELGAADLVLSTVTTEVALEAARSVVPHLKRSVVYIDLNATSPARKREIGAIIEKAGIGFVEGAILPAIGIMGAKSKVLVCGVRAEQIAETLNGLGLNFVFYGEEIGRASSFKMLRSVFSKGLEALLLECRLTGRRAGVEEDLWREIVATIDADSFDVVGGNWVRSHATAHVRRAHEIVQVEALLRELGLDPVMTAATLRLFDRSTRLALKDDFAQPPENPGQVTAALDAKLKTSNA
jgi:3-hydroxyisobutyrate dehydrogenase-like beta-hydroxyacid dehydrogenase